MYKALVSFGGKISMVEGEIRKITDKVIIEDLLKAGYIEELKEAKKILVEKKQKAKK